MRKQGKILNKEKKDRESLIISLKFYIPKKFTDKELIKILKNNYKIDITERTIRNYKRNFLNKYKKNLT